MKCRDKRNDMGYRFFYIVMEWREVRGVNVEPKNNEWNECKFLVLPTNCEKGLILNFIENFSPAHG